jgi:hypothetical protein
LGFEPTIPVFELEKTVHALDRAATVTGFGNITLSNFFTVTSLDETSVLLEREVSDDFYFCGLFNYIFSTEIIQHPLKTLSICYNLLNESQYSFSASILSVFGMLIYEVILQKSPVVQPLKNFPIFYGA